MTDYYTAVERTRLPASDPLRWMVLVHDAPHVMAARMEALEYVSQLPGKGFVVWASVRDCPTFEHMQQLRAAMDSCGYARAPRKQGKARMPDMVPGYC